MSQVKGLSFLYTYDYMYLFHAYGLQKGDDFAGGLTVPQNTVRKYGGGGSTNELYAEIDPDAMAQNNQNGAQAAPSAHASFQEELYAEIDTPSGAASNAKPPSNKSSSDRKPGDPPYEKVGYNGAGAAQAVNSKGEPIDSAGYAIVKESTSPVTVPSTNDDEEDYAECDPLSESGASASKPIITDDSITGSDSGYATVTYNGAKSSSANAGEKPPEPPATPHPTSPPPGAAGSSGGVTGNEGKPFQKYVRKKEHLYQEIDEVRLENNPPDKKKKKDKDKDKK